MCTASPTNDSPYFYNRIAAFITPITMILSTSALEKEEDIKQGTSIGVRNC